MAASPASRGGSPPISRHQRSVRLRPIADTSQTCILCDVAERPTSPFHLPSRWEAVSLGLSAFLAYLLFAYVLGEGRGTVAGAS